MGKNSKRFKALDLEPRLTKGQKTALHILKTAAECIASLGVEKTSITAIADRAGVSRSLVAKYFPEKDRLFESVISHIIEEGRNSIDAHPANDLQPLDQMIDFYRRNFQFFTDNPTYYSCFFLFYYYSTINPEFKELNSRLFDHSARRYAAVFREEGAEIGEWLAAEVISLIQRFYMLKHGLSRKAYLEKSTEELRQKLSSWL